MNKSQILRFLVVLEWIYIIAAVVLSSTLENQLPLELKAWLDMQIEAEISTFDIVVLVVGLPALVASIAGSIGLFLLKKWGAWTFLISGIISYALFPFAGPTVEHAVADMIDEFSVITAGMIIALAFFTDTLNDGKAASAAPNPPITAS